MPKEILVLSKSPAIEATVTTTADVTDTVSPKIAELTVDSMWAFPGLSATAVDIQSTSLDDDAEPVVIGLDPSADISEFLYPTFGRPRRVSMNVIHHMVSSSE